jgi:hypothetical protein
MATALTWARPTKRATQPLTTAEQTAKTKMLTLETQNKKVLQGPKEPMQTTGTERPRAKGKIGTEGTSRSRMEATTPIRKANLIQERK